MVRRLLTVGLVFAILLGGCGFPFTPLVGSGKLVTQEYDITGFDQVEASGAFNVAITQGDEFKVTVTTDDNIADRIKVKKQGDTLILGAERMGMFVQGTLQAEVTMPALAGLHLSGASKGRFTGFEGDDAFAGDASGASLISGELTASSVDLTLSGASNALLSGEATNLRLDASGASKAQLSNFPVVNADVSVSGASSAQVNVSGTLKGDASGASSVRYAGNPTQVRVDTSGASSVHQQ